MIQCTCIEEVEVFCYKRDGEVGKLLRNDAAHAFERSLFTSQNPLVLSPQVQPLVNKLTTFLAEVQCTQRAFVPNCTRPFIVVWITMVHEHIQIC